MKLREYHPLSEMERVPAEELPKRLDELFDRMDKENVGFVVTEEGKDSCVFCPYKWFELEYETIAKEVEAKSSIKVLANISRMSALRMSVPSRTSKMRMQQVTAFADIAALSPSSTVRRAMCCRDTARAMPPLCFSKIGLLAFQHQSATGGSSPLAKAMRSCFIIKTPSATRRQALCLDITFSGLARTRFPATLSTSATMTSTVICTPSILFSQRKIALRP